MVVFCKRIRKSEIIWGGTAIPRAKKALFTSPGTPDEASKVMAPLFSLVSNVQTTVGGGVDMCAVRDGQQIDQFTHSFVQGIEGV